MTPAFHSHTQNDNLVHSLPYLNLLVIPTTLSYVCGHYTWTYYHNRQQKSQQQCPACVCAWNNSLFLIEFVRSCPSGCERSFWQRTWIWCLIKAARLQEHADFEKTKTYFTVLLSFFHIYHISQRKTNSALVFQRGKSWHVEIHL